MGEGAGDPRSGRGRGGGRGEVRRPEGRGGASGGEGGGKDGGRGEGGRGRVGKEAAESLHRPDAAATADAAAILIERSGCARLFPSGRRSPREAPRALIPPPPALASPPALPLGLRTHAARSAPRRGPLAALPFLFRPASPPSAHPLGASAPRPAPPRPDLRRRPEGRRQPARPRGGGGGGPSE